MTSKPTPSPDRSGAGQAFCQGCGSPLDEGGAEAICPACLFAGALEGTLTEPSPDSLSEDAVTSSITSIPSLEELRDDFPELEILELIGRGGMGAVFKARQQSLDRMVALKVLPAEWNTSASFRQRFEREAKTLASLNHPNIVTIHEFGERNGRFFFTMEFVDGTDLARMLDDGPLEPTLALTLIPPICEAIQMAHNRGVIHRDIKPGNILVDREGRVKIADFGIAKLGSFESAPTEETSTQEPKDDLTATRGILGTPRYMAPEQAQASHAIDHRADLYALGVVFYEMLTGTSPTPTQDRLVPPSSHHGQIGRRWDKVILRALEHDPDRRYQHATEIKTAVESILEEETRRSSSVFRNTVLPASLMLAFSTIAILTLWPKPASENSVLTNSLGMTFVPVPGIEGWVSVWETRVRDYAAFVEETDRPWRHPPFEQTDDHPVVQVSWHDARAFCQWLTESEHQTGRLPKDEVYRLPTDAEWSAMAGLQAETGSDPIDRHLGQTTFYPWGEARTPPSGAGNYPDRAGSEGISSAAVFDYDDEHVATAPVGQFTSTKDGLYDLGGNVWEWTATRFSPTDDRPASRGGGWWAPEADDDWQSLLSSYRRSDLEPTSTEAWDVGFRIIRSSRLEAQDRSLFGLALQGDLEGVRQAIKKETNLNARNGRGKPLLLVAVESGNLALLQLLHEKNAQLEARDTLGRTALHTAAELGDTDIVNWLLDQEVNPRPRTVAGEEPLYLALARAPLPLLDRLLEAGGPGTMQQEGPRQRTLLDQACIAASDSTVSWVIEQLAREPLEPSDSASEATTLMALVPRASHLVAQWLVARNRPLHSQTIGAAYLAAINSNREQNFQLIVDALRGQTMSEELLGALGGAAVIRGRPWAIEALTALGWDPTTFKPGQDILGPLFTTNVPEFIPDGQSRNLPLAHLAITDPQSKRHIRQKVTRWLDNDDSEIRALGHRLFRTMATWPAPRTRGTLRALHKHGVDLDARTADVAATPLLRAAMTGNLAAVETLIELGADKEAEDKFGFTPLLGAVEKGHLDVVQTLERLEADLNARTASGSGVLHVVNRQAHVLEYLLTKDLEIDAPETTNGATPLISHAGLGDEAVLSLFLNAGADPTLSITRGIRSGYTALHQACLVESEEDRAKRKAHAQLQGHEFALLPQADREERQRAIRLLVEAGADPMAKSTDGSRTTPLHLAAIHGLDDAVSLFLESPDSDVNVLNGDRHTPLHLAAMHGQFEVARILLDHDASTHDPRWFIPLAQSALMGDNAELLELLIDHGAPLDRRDTDYLALPIHHAAHGGHAKMLKILLDRGKPSDRNARDGMQHDTPLHAAASQGQEEAVRILWEKGALMNARNIFHLTPAQLAEQRGHSGLATRLKQLAKTAPPVPAEPTLEP